MRVEEKKIKIWFLQFFLKVLLCLKAIQLKDDEKVQIFSVNMPEIVKDDKKHVKHDNICAQHFHEKGMAQKRKFNLKKSCLSSTLRNHLHFAGAFESFYPLENFLP